MTFSSSQTLLAKILGSVNNSNIHEHGTFFANALPKV
jgi:hypothetical protein